MKKYWENKATRGSVISAVAGLVGLIAYTVYGFVFDYFDTAVFAAIVLGIILAALDVTNKVQPVRVFNLLCVVCLSFAIGVFFMNSFPVWADNLNGITMYGSRGGLPPVIAIMVIMLVAIISGIRACFAGEED